MANNDGEDSKSRMIPTQSEAPGDQEIPNGNESDGNGQRFSARRSRMGRGYHTDDHYRPQRRRGDPFYDDYSRNDEEDGRSRSRDGFARNPNLSQDRHEGRGRVDKSESYYGPPPRGSMEGGYSSFESNSRGSRFDDRDHQSRFDDRDHRSKYDDREHRSKYDDRRSPERFRNRPSESEEREWPPCFDSDGSAFVFDNRSAMFYESQSNFFYDPKSKLYYGNKKGAYFRYDKSQDPPFVQVQKMPATSADGETPKDASEMTAEPIPNTLAKPKPTIAINLKTTKKPKQAKRSLQGRAAPVVSKVEKERIANIEKWNEKQAEMKPESTQKISTTLKGEPICTICKRKFPSIEKLRLHERASELHKSNLAKLANAKEAENAKQKEAPAGTYQDRAQKRRDLHGIDAAPLKKPGLYQEQSPTSHPTPSEGLGSNNIGNQMLKKMGWQESDKPEEGQQSNIRKDWDRIESLANSRQRPPR